jgi:hypothetical protein
MQASSAKTNSKIQCQCVKKAQINLDTVNKEAVDTPTILLPQEIMIESFDESEIVHVTANSPQTAEI